MEDPERHHEPAPTDGEDEAQNYIYGARLYIISTAFTMAGIMLTIDGSILGELSESYSDSISLSSTTTRGKGLELINAKQPPFLESPATSIRSTISAGMPVPISWRRWPCSPPLGASTSTLKPKSPFCFHCFCLKWGRSSAPWHQTLPFLYSAAASQAQQQQGCSLEIWPFLARWFHYGVGPEAWPL